MIDELLAYAGIDDRYADAFGTPAVVARETKIAMLAALGYAVKTDSDAARVLARCRKIDAAVRFAPSYVTTRERLDRLPAELRGQLPARAEYGQYLCEGDGRAIPVVIAPARAYVPNEVDEHPRWGIAAQLYSLRSGGNGGIGDFTDLATLVRIAV